MNHSPDGREITTQFEKLLVALATDGVDFAVVGGLAVILNGYPRTTQDADIGCSLFSMELQTGLEIFRASAVGIPKASGAKPGQMPTFTFPGNVKRLGPIVIPPFPAKLGDWEGNLNPSRRSLKYAVVSRIWPLSIGHRLFRVQTSPAQSKRIKVNQGESNQIKPDLGVVKPN